MQVRESQAQDCQSSVRLHAWSAKGSAEAEAKRRFICPFENLSLLVADAKDKRRLS
ncbi:hypothetical protein BAUCODRAFT_32168 [Baudoinia panamericana UAMH 10762]|uniref:Uncharacterized protein n=1 Tax=Baudoinia panamericana (strain UAMH 10762) TaxID=717646 RepID=M2LUC5_BAUPA|nr:uncharacterized protein BAUCODRAFT_32168 [Baudoinia panamericana UAMH 10762]EMC98167.1 hypothetical protein BAUCODRAFT_32168 [Baudoinia panamericana UAMH 10762]